MAIIRSATIFVSACIFIQFRRIKYYFPLREMWIYDMQFEMSLRCQTCLTYFSSLYWQKNVKYTTCFHSRSGCDELNGWGKSTRLKRVHTTLALLSRSRRRKRKKWPTKIKNLLFSILDGLKSEAKTRSRYSWRRWSSSPVPVTKL